VPTLQSWESDMWRSSSFNDLVSKIPATVAVEWDRRPSAQKYGHTNALLAVVASLIQLGGVLTDHEGAGVTSLCIAPIKRRLTDKQKRVFSIVGHETARPLVRITLEALTYEVYFNHHLFVQTETTYRQYFPSASVVLRCEDHLQRMYSVSPGSWGSDVIQLTTDWPGTVIVEASLRLPSGPTRRNFRGFKLLETPYKYLMTASAPTKSESIFLRNNGFEDIIVCHSAEEGLATVSGHIAAYHHTMRTRPAT
jgi:hypothetical protein